MVCIYCGGSTSVKNSRLQRHNNHIWRRRACMVCGDIFTTEERPELLRSFMVNKPAAGGLEPFNRDLLFLAIYESCRHRPSALADASSLTQTVINQLLPIGKDGVIERESIIEITRLALSRLDVVAGTLYTAYHR